MQLEHVDRVFEIVSSSLFLQVLVIFPTLTFMCYVFGFFNVWIALIFTTIYYIFKEHSNERERFNRSYLWTLRTLIDKRNELPLHPTKDDISKGVGGAGETHLLATLSALWWKTNAHSLFQDKILPKIIDSLNSQIQNSSMVDSFTDGKVYLSDEGPKLLSVDATLSSYNSIVCIFI